MHQYLAKPRNLVSTGKEILCGFTIGQTHQNAMAPLSSMETSIRLLGEGKEIIKQCPQGKSCLVDDNRRHATMASNFGVRRHSC